MRYTAILLPWTARTSPLDPKRPQNRFKTPMIPGGYGLSHSMCRIAPFQLYENIVQLKRQPRFGYPLCQALAQGGVRSFWGKPGNHPEGDCNEAFRAAVMRGRHVPSTSPGAPWEIYCAATFSGVSMQRRPFWLFSVFEGCRDLCHTSRRQTKMLSMKTWSPHSGHRDGLFFVG